VFLFAYTSIIPSRSFSWPHPVISVKFTRTRYATSWQCCHVMTLLQISTLLKSYRYETHQFYKVC